MAQLPQVSASSAALGAAACLATAGSLQAFVSPGGMTPSSSRPSSFLAMPEASSAPEATSSTMPRVAIASLAAGAAALAAIPTVRGRRTATARRAEKEAFACGLVGGQSAFGSYNFDPLELSERCPQFLPWFREAELKHGRVAMMAWVGLVAPEVARIPGPSQCYGSSVVDAHNACVGNGTFQDGPLFQVFLFCGIVEMLSTFPKCAQGLTLENAGDYKLGTSFLPKEDDKVVEMKLKELKNGRLAMLAFGGAITQAVLTGNGFPWLYANRPSNSSGLAASVPAPSAGAVCGSSRVARAADEGYKMSKSVPFLPVSPALEGYVGEEDGFDPMGFSLAIDIRWLREAELKHARVCMLATLGWVTTDLGVRVPGEAFQVSTVDAHDAMVKFGNMTQMLCWIGFAELFGFLAIVNAMEGKTDRKPGDFGLRTLYPKDAQGQYDMQLKELRNGRLAMLAFSGMVTAAVLTGKTWPFFATGARTRDTTMFGSGSALCGGLQGARTACTFTRAEEEEVVPAQPLVASASLPFMPKPLNLSGYIGEEQEFDPLGFSDQFDIKWLREAELKHGRVCMLATVGFFAQQYIAFPGYPLTENANDALYTAPVSGMATLLFLAGYLESTSNNGKMTMLDMFEDPDREPGNLNFGSQFLKGKSEQEIKDLKLKELNNGRLAMMAIGGMIHHNYVVKGPLFPLFPDGWQGPQGTWELNSVMGGIQQM